MAAQPPDVVCFYVDLGRPYYPLIKRMTESAGDVLKGSRRVLVSPNPSPSLSNLFDKTFKIDVEPTWDKLCFNKANTFTSWMTVAENRTIFADPDIEFKREPEWDEDTQVTMSWRTRRPDQPVNLGMLMATPGAPDFWKRYAGIVQYLPAIIHPWWCDQLGFSILLGADHKVWDRFQVFDAMVKLIPMELMCAPEEKALPEVWATHYKGARKGAGWETYFGSKSAAPKKSMVV